MTDPKLLEPYAPSFIGVTFWEPDSSDGIWGQCELAVFYGEDIKAREQMAMSVLHIIKDNADVWLPEMDTSFISSCLPNDIKAGFDCPTFYVYPTLEEITKIQDKLRRYTQNFIDHNRPTI